MASKPSTSSTTRSVKKSVPKTKAAKAVPSLSVRTTAVKKRSSQSKVLKPRAKREVVLIEELTLAPEQTIALPPDITKEYVVVHRCVNCEHVPFSLNKLVTLFSVLIMILSLSVLIQVGAIDLDRVMAFLPSGGHVSASVSAR